MFLVLLFVSGERFFEQPLIRLNIGGISRPAQWLDKDRQRVESQDVEEQSLFSFADLKREIIAVGFKDLHLVALHRRVQTVFLKLVHVVFRLLQGLAC